MNKTLLQWMAAAWAIGSLGCLTASAAPATNPAPQLFGITFLDNQIITINPTNGDATLVGNIPAAVNGYGIATRNGLLYSFSGNNDLLIEINPTNASVIRTLTIGVTNLQGEGDLAFRSDGAGFLASAFTGGTNLHATNGLYEFDLIGGTAQLIGTTAVTIDALAFDSQNVLYALAQDGTDLYIVNQTNASVTVVGSLGLSASSPFAGLTFGPDGTLYAAINDELYVIDKNTGEATLKNDMGSDMGYYSISGLAYQSPVAPTATKLVGVTFGGNQLFTVEQGSGTGGLIGNLGTNVSAYGLATYSNTLYTFSPTTQKIVVINPTTGAISNSISIGVTNLQGEGDLAISSTGIGFLATAFTSTNVSATNGLYTFSLAQGTSQFIGTTTVAIDALAFDGSNTLYALGQDDTNLYIVNQTNGSLTRVGPLGVALASPYAGLAFSPEGILYAAINDSLYTIDKTTGTATAVSTNSYFGFDSVSGLTFAPAPPPIPFFNGAESLGNNNFFLSGTNGNTGFGYYTLFYYPNVYQYDLGFEYFIDANNSDRGAYLYDYASGTFFYTSPNLFPYIYDFTLNSFLYYYPDPNRPGHYSTNPRYFYNFATGQIITK